MLLLPVVPPPVPYLVAGTIRLSRQLLPSGFPAEQNQSAQRLPDAAKSKGRTAGLQPLLSAASLQLLLPDGTSRCRPWQ